MTSLETASDRKVSLPPMLRRIFGLVLRHVYLYLGSWPRVLEMMYWPIVNIALMGFVSLSFVRRLGHVDVMTDAFLAGLLLAEIFTRSIMGTLLFHMEEIWSRNLGHMFASPLRLRDYIGGAITISFIRCFLSIIPAYILASYLFHFSILRLGWNFPLFAFLLAFNAWWVGLLIISLLFHYGMAAEWFGWMCIWLLMPFMSPYYDVSILPAALQVIARLIPGTYVFDSVKSFLATGSARYDYLALAFALNVVYFIGAMYVFIRAHRSAKRNGGLLQMGE